MSVVKYPVGLLSSPQLRHSGAQLSGMLEELSTQLMQMRLEVTKASDAPGRICGSCSSGVRKTGDSRH